MNNTIQAIERYWCNVGYLDIIDKDKLGKLLNECKCKNGRIKFVLKDVECRRGVFNYVDMIESEFEGVIFDRCTFYRAGMGRFKAKRCIFRDCSFIESDLSMGEMKECVIDGCTFLDNVIVDFNIVNSEVLLSSFDEENDWKEKIKDCDMFCNNLGDKK